MTKRKPRPPRLVGPLRLALEAAAAQARTTMTALTVQGKNRDPFRLDTERNHRYGRWMRTVWQESGRDVIHLRGLHYVAVSLELTKPDGGRYQNNDKDWVWLCESAAKAARWLGEPGGFGPYVPFSAILDRRNDAAQRYDAATGVLPVMAGLDVWGPVWDEVRPQTEGDPRQPNRVVLWAEKASAEPVLMPLAQRYGLTLYVGKGDTSDTAVYEMATETVEDGRPLVLLTLADCDPSGWNMPIVMARKMQALRLLIPDLADLEFRVRRVGMTPDQVREHNLPMTPLKLAEARADTWREQTGVHQTELDALATLNPEVLAEIVETAIQQVMDPTLAERTRAAAVDWQVEADEAFADQADHEALAAAEIRLAGLRDEAAEVESDRRAAVADVVLPDFQPPEAEIPEDGTDLARSNWDFLRLTRALLASKRYEEQP